MCLGNSGLIYNYLKLPIISEKPHCVCVCVCACMCVWREPRLQPAASFEVLLHSVLYLQCPGDWCI